MSVHLVENHCLWLSINDIHSIGRLVPPPSVSKNYPLAYPWPSHRPLIYSFLFDKVKLILFLFLIPEIQLLLSIMSFMSYIILSQRWNEWQITYYIVDMVLKIGIYASGIIRVFWNTPHVKWLCPWTSLFAPNMNVTFILSELRKASFYWKYKRRISRLRHLKWF